MRAAFSRTFPLQGGRCPSAHTGADEGGQDDNCRVVWRAGVVAPHAPVILSASEGSVSPSFPAALLGRRMRILRLRLRMTRGKPQNDKEKASE